MADFSFADMSLDCGAVTAVDAMLLAVALFLSGFFAGFMLRYCLVPTAPDTPRCAPVELPA